MNREKLFKNLEKRYTSKRDMISRIPLGVNPDSLWQELLNLLSVAGAAESSTFLKHSSASVQLQRETVLVCDNRKNGCVQRKDRRRAV